MSAASFNYNKDSIRAESFLSLSDCRAPTAPNAICDFGQTVPVAWRNLTDHTHSTTAPTITVEILQTSPAKQRAQFLSPCKVLRREETEHASWF
ncbi:uncharacterized protein AKAME5_000218400 [Lates japonicus]|uniref:Uncharacterized protein n=1 Tax=Lates japonicus TaxID=270547 RepID=A0AAD3M5S8_LATJO|nr:uncharacterized protein AKAME5_000218400 [Lates japonicus]